MKLTGKTTAKLTFALTTAFQNTPIFGVEDTFDALAPTILELQQTDAKLAKFNPVDVAYTFMEKLEAANLVGLCDGGDYAWVD